MNPVSLGVPIYGDIDIDAMLVEVDNRGVRTLGVGVRPDDERGPPVHLPDRGGHAPVLLLLSDEGWK